MSDRRSTDSPIDLTLSDLRKRRIIVSLSTMLGLGGAGLWAHQRLGEHMDAHFTSTAEAQVLSDSVRSASESARKAAESADSTSKALTAYISHQDLKDAKQRLNVLNEQLSGTKLWEATNPANEISRARKADLERQIAVLATYIACLEAERSYCVQ